jgi:glycerophosphoryl diester phosphodiesterase
MGKEKNMNPWIHPEKPLVIAHRGYSLVAPENTLLSYQKAIESGADMIELDINLTSDGELVMIHDHRLERTTNGTGYVHEHSLSEIQSLDAGYHFKPYIKGTTIPTTEQTIKFAIKSGIRMCFEIKGGEVERSKIIARKLIELLIKYNAFKWASISSYFPEASEVARKLCSELVITRERLPDDSKFDLQEAIKQANLLNSPIMLSDFHTIDKKAVEGLHKAGIAMWAWNPFERSEIEQVISYGVDGIMGDNPEVARKLVDGAL